MRFSINCSAVICSPTVIGGFVVNTPLKTTKVHTSLGFGTDPLRMGSRQSSAPEGLHPAPSKPTPCTAPPARFRSSRSRIRRPADSGEGKVHPAAPPSPEHAEDGRSAAELLGPPPPERKTFVAKRHSGRAAHSPTPPSIVYPCTLHSAALASSRGQPLRPPAPPHPPASSPPTCRPGTWSSAGATRRCTQRF